MQRVKLLERVYERRRSPADIEYAADGQSADTRIIGQNELLQAVSVYFLNRAGQRPLAKEQLPAAPTRFFHGIGDDYLGRRCGSCDEPVARRQCNRIHRGATAFPGEGAAGA